MSIRKSFMIGTALTLFFGVLSPAVAQDDGNVGTEVLKLLVEQGIVTKEKADGILAKARKTAEARQTEDAAGAKSPGAIDVTYVPQTVQDKIKEDVKKDVTAQAKTEGWMAPNTLPAWVNRISVSGDFRLRSQIENFDKDNYPYFPDVAAINKAGGITDADGFPLMNSTIDRERVRYRARLDVKAQITDKVMVDLRLASGGDSSPVSTNETMGDVFQKDAVWIDRAYASLTPVEGVSVLAGRMPNPFYSTDLVWDADINPEGLAVAGRYDFNKRISVFGAGGAFPLTEREIYDDSYLFAAQAGVDLYPNKAWNLKLASAYYDFQEMQSKKNAADGSRLNDYTAPSHIATGNSVFNMRTDGLTTLAGLASDFKLLAFTGETSYSRGAVRYRLWGEFVKNLALDAAEVDVLRGEQGVTPGDTGYQIGLDIGHRKIAEFGDWNFGVAYKYLETDAVLDIFTDSDFGLGGTDVKGYVVRGEFGIYKGTSIGLSWYSSNSINRPPFAVDVLQVNLNVSF